MVRPNPNPTPCRDFFFWPYDPPQPAAPDALDGAALLLAAAEVAGCADDWRALIADVRAALGPYSAVCGVKNEGGRFSAEIYFTDYDFPSRRVSLRDGLAALGRHARTEADVDDAVPYFMASVDLPMASGAFPAVADAVDVYLSNPGGAVSGNCYRVTPSGCELKSYYLLFDRSNTAALPDKVRFSLHAPPDLAALLPSWLTSCRHITAANKRKMDGLYMGGITSWQLRRFLMEHDWPAALAEHLAANADRYRHLLFDVGFDYTTTAGRLTVPKTAFYVCI